MDCKDSKRTDRTVHLAMCGARQAMAGIDLDALDRNRIGVVIGSGIGGIATFERAAHHPARARPRQGQPVLHSA